MMGRSGIVGLSPRVRGNPPLCWPRTRREGSIPACAGEPWALTKHPLAVAVYPRVCGGTPGTGGAGRQAVGLSPRVRGNPACIVQVKDPTRSIPACAGEPDAADSSNDMPKVYPRVCGGTTYPSKEMAMSTGLSPRVRGNRIRTFCAPPVSGSIPACAGEPTTGQPFQSGSGVYPRVCGGTPSSARRLSSRPGLSPRVRGNPVQRPAPIVQARSIPACAGEPHHRYGIGLRLRVYPRVCGGTRYYRQGPRY